MHRVKYVLVLAYICQLCLRIFPEISKFMAKAVGD